MMAVMQHSSLNAELQGMSTAEGEVWQFRGIPYATIPARFAKAVDAPSSSTTAFTSIDCMSYG